MTNVFNALEAFLSNFLFFEQHSDFIAYTSLCLISHKTGMPNVIRIFQMKNMKK